MFLDRKQIGKDLSWMKQISQTIDHRNRRVFSQRLDLLMTECPDHNPIKHAREHPSGGSDRLTPAKLNISTT